MDRIKERLYLKVCLNLVLILKSKYCDTCLLCEKRIYNFEILYNTQSKSFLK